MACNSTSPVVVISAVPSLSPVVILPELATRLRVPAPPIAIGVTLVSSRLMLPLLAVIVKLDVPCVATPPVIVTPVPSMVMSLALPPVRVLPEAMLTVVFALISTTLSIAISSLIVIEPPLAVKVNVPVESTFAAVPARYSMLPALAMMVTSSAVAPSLLSFAISSPLVSVI